MPKLVLIALMILLQMWSIVGVSKMELVRRISDTPTAVLASAPALAPSRMVHIRLIGEHKAHDTSAGGDVILGGFALAFVAAIVCYLRATTKNSNHQPEAKLPSTTNY